MTRKDYEKIASVFASSKDAHSYISQVIEPETLGYGVAWLVLREKIANVLQEDNDRFDKERFYKACQQAVEE